MKKVLLSTLLAAIISPIALAGPTCQAYPQNQWLNQESFKQQLTKQGYEVHKLRMKKNCYKMSGLNKDKHEVEVYFDAKTGKPVKSEIDIYH